MTRAGDSSISAEEAMQVAAFRSALRSFLPLERADRRGGEAGAHAPAAPAPPR